MNRARRKGSRAESPPPSLPGRLFVSRNSSQRGCAHHMFLLPCKKTLLHCYILITATHGPLPSKQSPPPPQPFPVLSLSISKSPGISYRLLLPLPRIPLALAKLSFSASTASFYSHSATGLPLFFLLLSALASTAVGAGPKSSNITIIGSVFCDFCANSSFSKHNYFLHGIFSLSLSIFLSILLLPLTRACTYGKMRKRRE